ncbi:hypothetical protein BDP81DRAFT_428647 [Colletotrichum phormii]|uniref:Uncharacterized protein n=1 Tax=Colletotrichum phormii TaxID=359342 RepID=A0AAJ0EFG3_9PEZI|nr:uncharacterized protein BDP81DRAFT_428647 [Colletotrichum phormii]KAK1636923.1 hypothetical protein BDP81DRAFT_428647 [Colletotrichum phormii]
MWREFIRNHDKVPKSTLEEVEKHFSTESGIVVTTTGDELANNAEASIVKVGGNGIGERPLERDGNI